MDMKTIEINGKTVQIPAYYQQVDSSPEDPEGSVPFIVRTEQAICFVLIYPITMSETVPREQSDRIEAVSKRDFSSLPDFIGETAKEALEQITKTGNAQLCDALIDRKTLETILAFSKNSGDELLTEYANSYCLAADIKTAYRAIKTKKSSVFLNTAIAENDLINKESFIEAALSGEEEFFEYLSSAGFSDYKDALSESSSAFEKYCDDKLLTLIKKAKMTAFGLSPLAAYFVAKETEIKCLRIILSAKQSHISSDIIRERMREVYV